MSFSLVQLNGTVPGASIELAPAGPPVTIGRDPQRDIPVDDHLCSRLHARVWFDGTAWRVEDCGSRNGTFVNSRQIENEVLQPGDAIRVGERLLVLIEQGHVSSGAGWQPELIESTTFVARVAAPDQKNAVVGQLKDKSDPDSVRNAAILCRLVDELHSRESVEEILEAVLEALEGGTRADAIVVWLTAADGRLRRYGAKPDDRPEAPSPLASMVMDQQDALLVEQPGDADSSLESTVIDERPGSAICVPLPYRNECRGAIEVLRYSLTLPLKQSSLELAIAIGRQAGMALENLEYRERLEQANQQLRTELTGRNRMIGESEAVQQMLGLVERVAATNSTVLISGESGSGKELVARMIHDSSPRSAGPYVAVNCAAFNEALLESELFGHEQGAFTGAERRYAGRFEQAHRGTLFLDEIGEMSLACQSKLLRLLEGHKFERLGGTEPISVDVRIVAATHRKLSALVADEKFREDLYFRLRVIELTIPPLRDRGDDVVLLAEHFLADLRRQTGRGPTSLSAQAVAALCSHQWPGNVRELKNSIERAAVLGTGSEVTVEDLGLSPPQRPQNDQSDSAANDDAPQSLADAELRHIQSVLRQTGGNKMQACRILGIGRGTLYKKLKEIEERFGT